MPTIGVAEASALLELIDASSGSVDVGAAYQLCQLDPQSPGIPTNIRPWRALGSATAAGAGDQAYTGYVDLVTPAVESGQNVTNHFWIRFGVALSRASGSAVEKVDLAMTVNVRY